MRWCWIIGLFCFGLGSQQVLAQAFFEPTTHRQLNDQIDVLEDPGGKLSLSAVQSPEFAARFVRWPAAKGVPNFGFTESAYWLRLPLQRLPDAPANWILEIHFGQLSEITFYAPGQSPVMTGTAYPDSSRPIWHRFFAFPVTLTAADQYFYLRVRSNSSLTIPLKLWQADAFHQAVQKNYMVQFLYYGAMLALLLYNLMIYFSLRDQRFLYYALFAAFFGLAILAGNGFGHMLLWPDWPAFEQIAQAFLMLLAMALSVLFTRAFLGKALRGGRLDRLLQLAAAVFLIDAALLLASLVWDLPQNPMIKLQMSAALPVGLLVLAGGIQAWRQGMRSTRFFLLGWGVLWVGGVIGMLRAFGWLPSNPLTGYIVQIASGLEMLLLALALADIVREERSAREQAQSRALQADQAVIEALRSSEEQLERAVQQRTEELAATLAQEKKTLAQYLRFGAMVAHEFRNPLAIISSQLALLRKEHQLGIDQIEQRSSLIGGAVKRLSKLFDKWLSNDRLNDAQHRLELQPIAVAPWLRGIVDSAALSLSEHRLQLQLAEPLPTIIGDPALLESALENLIDNAGKYSPPGTTIRISTEQQPGWLGIAVSDQGCGMAAEHRAKIFEDYFRVQPESAIPGIGLGLPLVKRIIEAHHGRIDVDSTLGRGSTFRLWLATHPNQDSSHAVFPA